jgi:hypothetical protein
MMTRLLSTIMATLALGAAVATTPALAETVAFKAALKGSEEVPPTTGSGSGSVDATFDTASKKLSWKGTYAGLSGAATAAHFHGPAEPGKNAAVAVPAPAPATPFEGTATLTDAQAADLMAGRYYFNIHTAANPGGEIRGQMMAAK